MRRKSHNPTKLACFFVSRHISVSFPVALDKDVETILSTLHAHLEHDERVLETPPLSIGTLNLTENVVEISVQAWTKADDLGAVRADLVRSLLPLVQASGALANAQ